VKGQKQQFVTIKGTKDGLTLHLDDQCSFLELVTELTDKLSLNQTSEDGPLLAVRLKVGNRYLTKTQLEELRTIIRSKKNLIVDTIESNIMTKAEALELKRQSEIISVAKIVRSGQVVKVDGDLLLLGDVNPGGTIMATGNIFVLGSLRGIAQAGCNGNQEAVIAASVMKPSQLRISEVVNRAPDQHVGEEQSEMECAYINKNKLIEIEKLQKLAYLRPNLTRFEGGI
jgi:septum site-determining protein MinC